jgi:predicted N-acyltransferase
MHYLAHDGLREAVAKHLEGERAHVQAVIASLNDESQLKAEADGE